MKILSHRGYWKSPAEKNTPAAFDRSFDLGFGTETDVRDAGGRLVISHDVPRGGEQSLESFLAQLGTRKLPLAINVKADGLASLLGHAMRRHGVADWFVFDMSIPDTRAQLMAGNPVFVRMSEVEREPPWLEQAAGIWLDSFDGLWYDAGLVADLLRRGKRVCVVSPELHGRTHAAAWRALLPLRDQPQLMLCTDVPEDAVRFFDSALEAVC